MRIILGFLSGVVGMLAGWSGLAFLVVSSAGPDRDGGLAMGAFFNIGPLGGLAGFGFGVWLFVKFGLVARGASFPVAPSSEPASASPPGAVVAPATPRISRPFAVVVQAIVGGLAWWAWYEFIRSPYLTHGFRQVGLERPCLSPAALDLLASASHGNPRLLNLLARAAWIAAAQSAANTIGPEHVQNALNLIPAAQDKINP